MQTVSSTLLARLMPGQARKPAILVELYASDYIPPDEGFDPADAEELFAAIQITWNGNEYRQELKQNPSTQKNQGKTLNSCNLSFSNLDRYMSAFVINTDVSGMWCVVRYVERDITDSSIVTLVGRLDEPGDLEMKNASLSAKQSVGSFSQEIPPESPLESLPFKQISGTFQQPILDNEGRFFPKFGYKTEQWSSIPGGHEPPLVYILGRAQVDTHGIVYADIGTTVKVLKYVAFGKLADMLNIRQVIGAPYSQPLGVTKHLGEADGVGTQTVDPLFPDIGQTFPGVAYIGLYVTGSSANAVDPEPYIVCVAVGEYALPDGSGDFTLLGASSSPPILWRHLMADPRMFNQPETLIDDESVLVEMPYCAEKIFDETNAERRLLNAPDFAEAGAGFVNYKSTGVLDTDYYKFELGLTADPTYERQSVYEEIDDITEPPDPVDLGTVTYLRTRYEVNVPIVERVNALDFLYDTFYAAFGGYHVTGANGKLKLRIEKPADNARLRSSTIVGATSLPVDDVTPWRASLAGEVVIGAHLTTSEHRVVTAANFSTAGNSVTFAKSVSGTITATVSGATLSGGNNSNTPATGTVTIGGTPASGNTVTVTIEGVSVVYTLNSSDTTGTVAALLADLINANATLKRIVSASWLVASPNVVTVTSKIGTLTVAALTDTHDAAEELIRVQMAFDASNIKPDSFKWPLGSKQKSYNQVEIKYVEASDDFAIQPPLRINDVDNQEKVKKKNTFKIDGTAIDNYNQAYRRANIVFSKIVEGNKFATWKTKTGKALLLEEGDIVCVSDDSTELVNYLVRLEELGVSGEAEVALTGRQYSTAMFSDDAAAHDIKIPSTLRGAKPTDVDNFVIDDASIAGIRLKWDIDPNESRVLTYRIERKDGAGAWTDAATVTGNTWTDHTPILASLTTWRIVALAGGARESETPTEVALNVSTFYGTTTPTGSKTARDYISTNVTVTPPVGMNAFGLASIRRTRIRVQTVDIFGPQPPDVDYWFEGGGKSMTVVIPTPKFIASYSAINFTATYEFAPGILGGTGSIGSILNTTTQAAAALSNLPSHTHTAGDITSGTLDAARMPALTGDVTSSAGAVATTLANSGVSAGTYAGATVTVDAKGRVTSASNAPAAIYADIYNSANISIPTGDPHTKLSLNSEASDASNLHSTVTNPSRVTIATTGIYLIVAGVIWLPNAGGGGSRYVAIFVNGAERGTPAVDNNASLTVGTYMTAIALLSLTAGDYIEIDVYQSAGSATSVYASGGSPTLRLVKLG